MAVLSGACVDEKEDGLADNATEGPQATDGQAFHQLCAAQGDRSACEGVPPQSGEVDGNRIDRWCTWQTWAHVELDQTDTCVFSNVSASCVADNSVENSSGCAGVSACDPSHAFSAFVGAFRQTATGVEVGLAQWCNLPLDTAGGCVVVGSDGSVESGPPECACLCDLQWPPQG